MYHFVLLYYFVCSDECLGDEFDLLLDDDRVRGSDRFFVNNESSVKHPSVCLAKCIGVHEANRKGTDNRQSSVIKGMLNTFIPHSRADAGPKLCSF